MLGPDRWFRPLWGRPTESPVVRQSKSGKDNFVILGMTTAHFTLVHVVSSLIGIVAGLLAVYGMTQARLRPGWTHLFLLTTVLTSATGYLFPVQHVMPSHRRCNLAGGACHRDARAVQPAPGGNMASNLRDHSHHRALSQCFCLGRAGIREGPGFAFSGS